jgi:hypothetical protein
VNLQLNRSWERSSAEPPALSVVMIGHRSAALLSRAIFSLLRFSPPVPAARWELVLVVNGESAEVREWAEELRRAERVPMAVVKVSERRPGAARNAGVRVSRAPVLFFLDDDVESYQDVVGAALELFRDPALMAAGGANLTPPGSSALARATGGVMGCWFGAAAMRRRYRVVSEGPADEHGLILCNLAVRKRVFEAERGFASHLISNEENVLLQRLAAKGARLWASPGLAVFHRRRDTWAGLCAQAAKYGAGRAQNLLLVPESRRALYFLPLLFTLYVVALPALLSLAGRMALAPIAVYAAAAAALSAARAVSARDPAHLEGVLVYPCVHLAYGFGFLRAGLGWIGRRKELREHAV